jgi:hypothetical protein
VVEGRAKFRIAVGSAVAMMATTAIQAIFGRASSACVATV